MFEICPFPIRHLTAQDRRDRAEEEGDAVYERICGAIEDAQRAEYEAEYGPEYCACNPYAPDEGEIHQLAMARIDAMREYD
jgi:hypothetical protein